MHSKPLHFRPRPHLAALLVLIACSLAAPARAAPEDFNGNWTVDEARSQDFETAGREFNKTLNEEVRRKRKQEFDRTSSADNRTRNKFQAAADATEEMIREDNRSNSWVVPQDAEPLVGAQTLKLYVARKVAVLYDGSTRRLLTINPGGRSFSLRGSEITSDEIGRALTYFDAGALVIESEFNGGGKLIERYVVDPAQGRLVVTLRVQELPRGPWLEFVREYVRAE